MFKVNEQFYIIFIIGMCLKIKFIFFQPFYTVLLKGNISQHDGKTGTAQKYENGVISQGKYVMSFVGFFPSKNPRYLALAIVDEPIGGQYGSTVAAPLVKEIFEGIISCKNL